MKKSKNIKKSQITNSRLRKCSKLISESQQQLSLQKRIDKNYIKNVQIEFDQFQELIEDVNIQSCINLLTKTLNVKKLVSLLERQFSIFAKDKIIKFYLEQGGVYLAIPSAKKSYAIFQIEEDDYINVKTIKLQMFKNKQLIDVVMQDSQQESEENVQDQQDGQNDEKIVQGTFIVIKGKCRRLKQRKIKHVVEKVLKWRQLYAPQNGDQNQKISLEEGAKIVKVSKKTLDDYLSQLKKGKKYGFNFNDHRNQKVGVLRQFIRKMEKKK